MSDRCPSCNSPGINFDIGCQQCGWTVDTSSNKTKASNIGGAPIPRAAEDSVAKYLQTALDAIDRSLADAGREIRVGER